MVVGLDVGWDAFWDVNRSRMWDGVRMGCWIVWYVGWVGMGCGMGFGDRMWDGLRLGNGWDWMWVWMWDGMCRMEYVM